jgi:hypothetical protein
MSGESVPYTDLLIRISMASRPDAPPAVEAIIDGDSLFYGGTLELDEQQLLAAEADNQAYGLILMKALFSEPIQRAWDRASAKAADRTGGQLRIRLQIDESVASLQAYRWERTSQIFGGQPTPLSIATRTPFSRFTGLEEASAPPLNTARIRAAVCISNPGKLPDGFVPVKVEDEARNLQKTIGSLRQSYEQLEVTIAPGRTSLPKDLLDSLTADGYKLLNGPLTLDVLVAQFLSANIVHFLGHGVFRTDSGPGPGTAALYLEKPDTGELAVTRDFELLDRIRGASQLPRLVVLMACESARRAGVQPFVGLAGKLVRAGVPAIFAMQTKVPMDDASELTKRFYAALISTGIVDFAANEARSYLYDSRKSDFSIPALFMRLQNGQLLAPDPARSALRSIVAQPTSAALEHPLPIDVVRITGMPSQTDLERLSISGEPPVDLQNATRDVFLDGGGQPTPGFVLLFGAQGTAKTNHLQRVAFTTAKSSLDSGDRIVPAYLNLPDYFNQPRSLNKGVRFRFLIDGNDELSDRQRAEAFDVIVSFAQDHNWHQFLFASDLCYTGDLMRIAGDAVTNILVIKPIAQNRAEQYLAELNEPVADRLKTTLRDKRLFDLASRPWLLIRMLEQARRGTYAESRAQVLKRVVDDALGMITAERGTRARAGDALFALAWDMHSRRKSDLPLAEAFPIIESVRGNRGFAVEDLFEELVNQNLLARVGQERLRFAYSRIQEFCCAQALASMEDGDRLAALDDITARLGRLTLLRWWDEPLIMLSGLLPPADTDRLIELVLYGSGFGEGERVFLAAGCIQECGRVKTDVFGQVVDGLVWRSKIANEPRTSLRIRAIEALAGLQAMEAIPQFTALAADKVRTNYIGEDDFEYPGVRLAATLALARMGKPAQEYLSKERPAVARTLDLWSQQKVEELGQLLLPSAAAVSAASAGESGPPQAPIQAAGAAVALAPAQPELSPSIAAFALGQLRTPRAAELLAAGFQNSALPLDTRWCITDTLKLLDPAFVNRKILVPFFDESSSLPPEVLKKRQYRYDQLAYLAGRIRSREQEVLAFLDDCLFKWVRVSLKGRAIRAIAAIYTPSDGDAFQHHKQCFEQIATGDFTSIPLTQPVPAADTLYLQVSALEALSDIGDTASLEFIRARRKNWPAEVERQFFVTSEEIYWRMMPESAAGA